MATGHHVPADNARHVSLQSSRGYTLLLENMGAENGLGRQGMLAPLPSCSPGAAANMPRSYS